MDEEEVLRRIHEAEEKAMARIEKAKEDAKMPNGPLAHNRGLR